MTAAESIAALLAEARTLTPEQDSARLCAIYKQAADLVDRTAAPKKWAAFRFMYGQNMESADPQAALAAYRESVACFDPVADRDMWMSCKACIGYGQAALGKLSPPESEEVIACLEAAVEDYPDAASTLARYYGVRVLGDPLENWTQRVHFFELALGQVSQADDPVPWAALKMQYVDALSQEPDGDFVQRTEQRIDGLKQVLLVLDPFRPQAGSQGQDQWIAVSNNLSEAYLSRPGKDAVNDRIAAMSFARTAYEACGPLVSKQTRAFATLSLARAMMNEDAEAAPGEYMQGLKLCDEAQPLIDVKTQPMLMATLEKFRELAHLRLLQAGETGHLDALLQAADSAFGLLDPLLHADLQRVVMQLAAEGLVAEGEYTRATTYLKRAVDASEHLLERATSRAARLEAIFYMNDTCAQLGFCLFKAGLIGPGIEALDRGKGRLWRPAKTFATFDEIKLLVPKGGALLFAAFVPKDGAVAIVAEQGTAVCELGGFGRERLQQVLLGDLLNPNSTSWIARYILRNVDLGRWHQTIDAIGGVLFATIWTPVLKTLATLGVAPGAELVWFPQAGLGCLPLHTGWNEVHGTRTWIADSYALRYAPSASCLIREHGGSDRTAEGGESTLVVSDPAGDLTNSALELTWVREADTAGTMTVLAGAAATKAQVIQELKQVERVHFSTHAMFRVDDPFKSGLLMANGELLLLEELLPLMPQAKLRSVVLSGCETAMAQVARRPDELLGFPSAFLEHGASTVVATQWPVDDWAAAALVGRFYQEWQRSGCSSAQALWKAQKWMREVTVIELRDLLKPLREEPAPVGGQASQLRSSLSGNDPQERPFAHPYFWAPFTVSGF